jgi:hypothetical protein
VLHLAAIVVTLVNTIYRASDKQHTTKMAPSWLPLFTSILEAHVGRPALSIILPFDESDSNLQIYQTASYLAAGSWCKILAMDKVSSYIYFRSIILS